MNRECLLVFKSESSRATFIRIRKKLRIIHKYNLVNNAGFTIQACFKGKIM